MKNIKNNSKMRGVNSLFLECIRRMVFMVLFISFFMLYEVSSKSQSDPQQTTKYAESLTTDVVTDSNTYSLLSEKIMTEFDKRLSEQKEGVNFTIEYNYVPYLTTALLANVNNNILIKSSTEDNTEVIEEDDIEENLEGELIDFQALSEFDKKQRKKIEKSTEVEEEITPVTEEIQSTYVVNTYSDHVDKYVYNDVRKSYMSWESISVPTSRQWAIQYSYATTDEMGMRKVDGHYLIAMGSYYSHNIGQYVDVYLENGDVIPCIIGDAKSDLHTNAEHTHGLDGSVVEFMVDVPTLPEYTRITGDISNLYTEWNSKVVMIRLWNKNLFE